MTGLLPLLLASLAMCSADTPFSNLKPSLPSIPKPSIPSIPKPSIPPIPKPSVPSLDDVVKARDAVAGNVTNATGGIGRGVQKEIAAVKQPIDETIAYVGSSQCTNVKKIFGVAYKQYEGEQEPQVDKLTLEYRDAGIRTIYNITSAAARIPLAREFNPAQKLYIFIHGFTDDPSKDSYSAISEAFLSKGQSNVLALDASSLIRYLYLRSSTYVRFIGEKLGEVLAAMVNKGHNPSAIHIIGHSLGSHISGFTGKTFADLTGRKVGRITGLDPAGPCFSHVEPELRLKATDAEYVDVIHTDAGVYGLKDPVGQVDYFPNSGSQQPNCLFQTCSHSRAWVYFAESVRSPDAFPSLKCKDYEAFRKGQCESATSPMGFASKPGTRGLYYLQTGEDSPYGRGKNGTKWVNNEGVVRNIAGHLFG